MGYWKTNAPADWTRRMGAGYVGRRGATYYEVNKVDGVWVAESYHIGADGSKNGQTRSVLGSGEHPNWNRFEEHTDRAGRQGLLCQHRWRLAESRMALCCKRCGARIPSEMEKRWERPWQTGSSAATL